MNNHEPTTQVKKMIIASYIRPRPHQRSHFDQTSLPLPPTEITTTLNFVVIIPLLFNFSTSNVSLNNVYLFLTYVNGLILHVFFYDFKYYF